MTTANYRFTTARCQPKTAHFYFKRAAKVGKNLLITSIYFV